LCQWRERSASQWADGRATFGHGAGFKLQGQLTTGGSRVVHGAREECGPAGWSHDVAEPGRVGELAGHLRREGYISTATYNYSVDYQQDGTINVLDYNFARGTSAQLQHPARELRAKGFGLCGRESEESQRDTVPHRTEVRE